jgi:hypothetical protein
MDIQNDISKETGNSNKLPMNLEENADKVNKMFDMSEKTIMEYISNFLDMDPKDLFKDPIPEFSKSIVLHPIKEYNKDKYLQITLKVMPCDYDITKVVSNNLLNQDIIKKSMGFLVYCVNSVYVSVVMANMKDRNLIINTELKFDDKTLGFVPVYAHELTVKHSIAEKKMNELLIVKRGILAERSEKSEILSKKYDVIETKVKEINLELNSVMADLISLNNQLNDTIITKLISDNVDKYKTKPVIGIVITELNEDQTSMLDC